MRWGKRRIYRWCSVFALMLGLTTEGVRAESVPAPQGPTQSTGSYTISYPQCSTCVWDGLYEAQGGSSSWLYVGRGSVSFSNRPEGTYRYRVHYGFYSGRTYSVQSGPEISVVVSSAPITIPSIIDQLQFRFETRGGDIDGDGRRDLLLQRIGAPAATDDGTIGSVLLRQTVDGGLIAAVPTGSELSYSSNWPLLSTGTTVRDVNIDGFADVVLTDISRQYGFESVRDQIALAHGQIGHRVPPTMVPVDANLQRFARDIRPHLLDPEFFPNNVPVQYAIVVYYEVSCYSTGYPYWGEQSYVVACYPYANYYYIVYRDFSVFHPDAIYIAGRDYSVIHGYETADSAFDEIERTLEHVLDVPVGGWDRQAVLGDVGDATTQRGMELFSVLGAIIDAANAQTGNSGPPATSNADRVLLTGRRVMGYGPFHTALQYGTTTISAHDDDDRALYDGYLVSQIDWPPDRPNLTMILGAVDGSTAPSVYWSALLAADSAYGDDLRYDAFPSIGAGGYNSNGFVSGIVLATGGVPTVSMAGFVGGEKPVPASEFR